MPIVEHLDELEDRGPCLGWTGVVGLVDELGLQRSKEALHDGVVPAVGAPAPTFSVSVSASQHLIIKVLRRPVEFNLTAAVRVMHQQLGPKPVGQSHAQGVQRESPYEAIRHRPSDHPARVQVKHHRQVHPATARPHVGVGVGPERPVVFRAMGFSGPPSEPDMRLSPHPALHVLIPLHRFSFVCIASTRDSASIRPSHEAPVFTSVLLVLH